MKIGYIASRKRILDSLEKPISDLSNEIGKLERKVDQLRINKKQGYEEKCMLYEAFADDIFKGRHEKNCVEGTGLHKRSAEGWEGPAVSLLMQRGVSPNAEAGLASEVAIRIRATKGKFLR